MTVLERSELQASTLSDLHAIADQLGLDGFRRLRKAELIDAILGDSNDSLESGESAESEPDRQEREPDRTESEPDRQGGDEEERASRPRRRRLVRSRRTSSAKASPEKADPQDDVPPGRQAGQDDAASAGPSTRQGSPPPSGGGEAEGVVELLGNGSAFLRVSPPEASDEDVYISAAQVRRCELVSGDRVTGPVRTPRRSERYPSLVRIDTINGSPADAVSGGARYDDLPAQFPSERLALGSDDPTLQAIEWLTPFGQGSRVVVAGAARAGKTETLRGLAAVLGARDDLQVTIVLAGCRPEEIAEWEEGPLAPVAALSLAASGDAQGQAVERAIEEAKRVASRGGNAVVLIDGLDTVAPHVARKALAAARNLRNGGSLTVIAAASKPFGGETTVITLDAALASAGQQPILDLANSGSLKAQLLVGEDGARAITRAHAEAAGIG